MSKVGSIPAKYVRPHYSTKFFKAYYNYLHRNYDGTLFSKVCDELGVPQEFLNSDSNWVSHAFLNDFLTEIKKHTKDEKIAYHVGRSLLSPFNINPFEYSLFKILPPLMYFLIISLNSRKLNRVSNYSLQKVLPGNVIIELSSSGTFSHTRDICLNAIGILEAFKDPMGLDSVRVEHTDCIHLGSKKCLFTVKYKSKKMWTKRLAVTAIFSVFLGFALKAVNYIRPDDLFFKTVTIFSLVSFFTLFVFLKRFITILKNNLIHNEEALAKDVELYEHRSALNFKHNEGNLLKELALTLNQGLTPNQILDLCLKELKIRFGYNTGMVMLLNEPEQKLYTQNIIGFDQPEIAQKIYKFSVRYPGIDPDSPDMFANILEQGKVKLIAYMKDYRDQLKREENKKLIDLLNVNSLIVAPIATEDRKHGLLIVGRFGGETPLNEQDQSLIEKVLQLLTLAFKNSTQLEHEKQLKNLFKKYVPAIVLDGLEGNADSNEAFAPQQMQIAAMFVDLRDFTKISENMEPFRVRQMLTEYVTYVMKIIAEAGGIIDKITGDGVNAFFLSHIEGDNPSYHAVSAGLALLADAHQLRENFREKGFKPPRFGVGINSGPAIVGAFGSEHKMEYAALGDTVNTASRLQTLCKEVSAEMGITEQSMMICSASVLSESNIKAQNGHLKSYSVRGKAEAVDVHVFVEEIRAAKTAA